MQEVHSFDRKGSPYNGRYEGAHVPLSSVSAKHNGAFGGLDCERTTNSFGDDDDEDDNHDGYTNARSATTPRATMVIADPHHIALNLAASPTTLRARAAATRGDPALVAVSPRASGRGGNPHPAHTSHGRSFVSSTDASSDNEHAPLTQTWQEARVVSSHHELLATDGSSISTSEAKTTAVARGEVAPVDISIDQELCTTAVEKGRATDNGVVVDGVEQKGDDGSTAHAGRLSMLSSQCSTE
jgi:hypothetical protein